MYPLKSIYGHTAYKTFSTSGNTAGSLAKFQQSSEQVSKGDFLNATRYSDLQNIVSFLSVMNKRHTLYFRGQSGPFPLIPAMYRSAWTSITGTRHDFPGNPSFREKLWNILVDEISPVVCSICSQLPMPRPATLRLFREAAWAVAQHYSLWPTPLIDITPNLRTAASFALPKGQREGYLYVVAMPPSVNSITFDADQHVLLARLHAVCPPAAKRPHFQDGYLVGRFPSPAPTSENIDDLTNKSDLQRRLVGKIRLLDSAPNLDRPPGSSGRKGFWSVDFPRMSKAALMPAPRHDQLLERFRQQCIFVDDTIYNASKDFK